ETDDVTLKPAEFYAENNITMLLGNGAKSVNTDAKTLTLADGSGLAYDELVIATGLVPKRIRSFPDLPGIHVLRNFDESLKLRQEA
ncbi:FAD-dependent oxidoreductase, partial [Mycobacterium sp. ITM-2017-0098]